MPVSERVNARVITRVVAALAVMLALITATAPASGGARAERSSGKPKPIGHVKRIGGDVTVGRGIPVLKKVGLHAGEVLTTGPSGEAKLELKLKRSACTVWSNTQLRVLPSRRVGMDIVSGDVACGTSSSPQLAVFRGPQFAISMTDPVFGISVRRNRAVIKVNRGSVILTGRSGRRGAVVVARKQQSVVPTGGDPREPQPIKLSRRERAAFAQLERRLPKLRDTTPPKTTILRGPPTPTKAGSATFAFRANETPVSYSCSLDGAGFRVCSSPATFAAARPGRHTFAVRATDTEGNVGSRATYEWLVTGTTTVKPDPGRQVIARSATDVRLEVDAQGRALVTYRSGGQIQSVLAWGAINAQPPTTGGKQVRFELLYGAPPIRDVCGPYRGAPLAWKVVACTAPDGTHWAIQQWQRGLPNYGVSPTPEQAAPELRLSHWSGPLARLEIETDWAYRRYDHLYGRLTYRGQPVHGFRSTSKGVPLDSFGRNIYVDTFDSAYGPGWKRENYFLAHRPTGAFCYGFYPHGGYPPGKGTRYRATVIGPGVTPDVVWEGVAPGPYDRERDQAANLEQRQLFGPNKLCKIN